MLQNRNKVLITGASAGIGKALAFEFARRGCDLILMARRLDLLQELQNDISKVYPERRIVLCVSDVADVDKHHQDVLNSVSKLGGLDIAIANAGMGLTSIETQNCLAQNVRTFQVNVLGKIATLEAAKDVFLKQGHGQLVGLTSVAAARGMPTSASYCASKTAVSIFLEGMRIDLANSNISVTAIHPGFVETELTAKNGPMPFLLSAERAAFLIARAIERRRKRFVFPWQMAIIYKLLIWMPNGLYDFIMKLINKKAIEFKQHRP